MTFFLHAPNIHQGGGRSLLLALLAAINDRPCIALLDERLVINNKLQKNIKFIWVQPTVSGRLGAEACLRRMVSSVDVVLCLGNLPPLFKFDATVKVYVQNRYLLTRRSLSAMPWRTRLRIQVERAWLRMFLRQVEILVQTPSMAREVAATLGTEARVLPFFGFDEDVGTPTFAEQRFDFLYVASGEPHKNHLGLVDAWCLLASDGLFPSLCLTLDPKRDQQLLDVIDVEKDKYQLRIENLGNIPASEVRVLYTRSEALIYPSFFESFGLPLIEARQAGIDILAGELDYVRDLSEPTETFDPSSAVSIARAVKRYLDRPEKRLEVLTPDQFLDEIMDNK